MARNRFHDVAQVCINGHIINGSTNKYSIHNKDYCPKCGSRTITTCLSCNNEIEGDYYIKIKNWATRTQSVTKVGRFVLPLFCAKCGKPYPWTEKKIHISQMLIAESEDISPEEKEIMSKSIDDIIKDTPETIYSANRIKKILPKFGKGIAKVLRDIFVDIASDAAKKILLP
jgi:hypothetical protein